LPYNISPEIQSRIRALCRRISVAHNLDEEIQRELYSHMEDKLLGYLSGEEKITEDDALILVREHFGDPAVIRELLRETYSKEVRVGFWRKIFLFWLACSGAGLFHYGLQSSLIGVFILAKPVIPETDSSRMLMKLLLAGTGIVSFLLLWYILLVWRRQIEKGHHPWILGIKAREIAFYFILAMIPLTVILNIFNAVIEYSQTSMLLRIIHPDQTIMDLEVIIRFMKTGAGVILNIVLIWWMDLPPRGARSLLNSMGYIILMYMLFIVYGFLMNLLFTPPGEIREMVILNMRNNGFPIVAAIGIYLMYYSYRCILDRRLKQIV
jgi:hypothetical protein